MPENEKEQEENIITSRGNCQPSNLKPRDIDWIIITFFPAPAREATASYQISTMNAGANNLL